jgi:hypothetical protein
MNMTTKTAEKHLEKRVEKAIDWDTFKAGIPTLHIVKDLHGIDQDGLAIDLDRKHKVAVHEFPTGDFVTVPALRSADYRELSHDYVYDKIHEVLEGAGLAHKVLSKSYTRSSGELHTDIVLEKAYKFDEKAFEDELGVEYTDDDKGLVGEYRPVIRVRNSFIRSSQIILMFLRVVCSNGMIAVAKDSNLSRPINFTHVGKVVEHFDKGVHRMISSLFEGHVVENMMMNLSAQPVEYEAVITWLINYLGKQATTATVDQFNLEQKGLDEFTNKWIAYNMITWAASNVVQSVNRRNKAMAALNTFLKAA